MLQANDDSKFMHYRALEWINQYFQHNLGMNKLNTKKYCMYPTQYPNLYISAQQQHSMQLANRTKQQDATALKGLNAGKQMSDTYRKCWNPKKGHQQCPGS